LPDIAATHREVQRVAGHHSNVVTSSALLQQRRKNVASYNALPASAATMLRAATLSAIAVALRGSAAARHRRSGG
jgi:hypothetical protein